MIIFTSSLIGIFLAVLETSFLPYFRLAGAVPFITITFITLLAVRYRGFFHFLLALFLGLYFDSISGGFPGLFAAVFVTNVIIGRSFFYRDTGYDGEKSYFWLLLTSTLAIYAIQLTFTDSWGGWHALVLRVFVATIMTLLAGLVEYKVFDRYVDWLNKANEEKYR